MDARHLIRQLNSMTRRLSSVVRLGCHVASTLEVGGYRVAVAVGLGERPRSISHMEVQWHSSRNLFEILTFENCLRNVCIFTL